MSIQGEIGQIRPVYENVVGDFRGQVPEMAVFSELLSGMQQNELIDHFN